MDIAKPPRADKRPVVTHHRGIEIRDDYAWLKADNWQEVIRDPSVLPADIRAHLEAENAWCDAAMADTKGLQEALVAEMRGRIKEDDSSVPTPHGPFAYATRYLEGAMGEVTGGPPTAKGGISRRGSTGRRPAHRATRQGRPRSARRSPAARWCPRRGEPAAPSR